MHLSTSYFLNNTSYAIFKKVFQYSSLDNYNISNRFQHLKKNVMKINVNTTITFLGNCIIIYYYIIYCLVSFKVMHHISVLLISILCKCCTWLIQGCRAVLLECKQRSGLISLWVFGDFEPMKISSAGETETPSGEKRYSQCHSLYYHFEILI